MAAVTNEEHVPCGRGQVKAALRKSKAGDSPPDPDDPRPQPPKKRMRQKGPSQTHIKAVPTTYGVAVKVNNKYLVCLNKKKSPECFELAHRLVTFMSEHGVLTKDAARDQLQKWGAAK